MFYIPKKNRCNNGTCNVVLSNIFTCFAARSSVHSSNISARSVYNTEDGKSSEYKNRGNLNKKGSGGNSYASYLSSKKGAILCNCDTTCDSKHN